MFYKVHPAFEVISKVQFLLLGSLDLLDEKRRDLKNEKRVKFEDSYNSRWSSLDREQSSVSGKMAQGLERQGSVTRTAGRSPPEMLRAPFSSFCAH